MIRNMCQLGVSNFNGRTGNIYPSFSDYFNLFYESGEIQNKGLLKFGKDGPSLEYGDTSDAVLAFKQAIGLG